MTLSTNKTRVFISYKHESPAVMTRVEQLAQALHQSDLEVRGDFLVKGIPPNGWQKWMEEELAAADFVLCTFSPSYADVWHGTAAANGLGRGTAFELSRVKSAVLGRHGHQGQYLAIVHDKAMFGRVDPVFENSGCFHDQEDFDELVRVLLRQPRLRLSSAGPPSTMPAPAPGAGRPQAGHGRGLALRLDRTHQWFRAKEVIDSGHSGLVLVHGRFEQDVARFLERMHCHFGDTRVHHQVANVHAIERGGTPTTLDEWVSRLRNELGPGPDVAGIVQGWQKNHHALLSVGPFAGELSPEELTGLQELVSALGGAMKDRPHIALHVVLAFEHAAGGTSTVDAVQTHADTQGFSRALSANAQKSPLLKRLAELASPPWDEVRETLEEQGYSSLQIASVEANWRWLATRPYTLLAAEIEKLLFSQQR